MAENPDLLRIHSSPLLVDLKALKILEKEKARSSSALPGIQQVYKHSEHPEQNPGEVLMLLRDFVNSNKSRLPFSITF